MASREVTGKTRSGLAELRSAFNGKPRSDHYDFEDYYCLSKIPRQPDDYDGPDRYCAKVAKQNGRCKHHGGNNVPTLENLDSLAAMKHGMKATRSNLIKDFSDADRELYNWVVDEWPEAYDISLEADPQAEYEFHALAVEIVRAERGEGYLIREGEKGQKKVFGPTGEVEFEDVPHYLADMMQRQRKLIMKMEDNLGISRKARERKAENDDAADIMKSFAEVGASLITKSDKQYDPDEFGLPDSDSDT